MNVKYQHPNLTRDGASGFVKEFFEWIILDYPSGIRFIVILFH